MHVTYRRNSIARRSKHQLIFKPIGNVPSMRVFKHEIFIALEGREEA